MGGEDVDDFLLDEGGVHVEDCEACGGAGDGGGKEDEFEGVCRLEVDQACMVAKSTERYGRRKRDGEDVWRILRVEEAVGVLDRCCGVGYGLYCFEESGDS